MKVLVHEPSVSLWLRFGKLSLFERRLVNPGDLPIELPGEILQMRVTVEVAEQVVEAAKAEGIPIADFVEALIAKGHEARSNRNSVGHAIERIRALRSMTDGPR